VIALSRGDWQGALSRLDAVIEADPKNSRAIFYRATALDHLDRSAEANELMRELLGNDHGKYGDQARLYLAKRNDDGRDDFAKASEN